MTPAPSGQPRLHLELSADARAAARAREATSAFLRETVLRGAAPRHAAGRPRPVPRRVEEAAMLIVTELVTNAVRHTQGPCTLELALHEELHEALLDIDVTDTSPEPPSPRPPHLDGTGGWGWILIGHLAREVTVQPTEDGGKTIHTCVAVE
ncbi:ATP-binding protein [Streptomyces sp. RerS4]|uniref:ATP-binding protein n=1 Tax=Streptomyces sp. RerS4 TaxID=2942449 RepID=UPI00201C5E08|nr:ATP-binding protein [Streptomyces sp. RerS4]UQW99606.1 ATP-binding protein [Streptomyces sp. RerS4]